MDAVSVLYQNPSGYLEHLSDAHNTFLNVAVQAGIFGLAALFLLLLGVVQVYRRAESFDVQVLTFAFLNAFAYQGLGGSFEDARHLRVLLGLSWQRLA